MSNDPLDENPSDETWIKAAECVGCDLDNFEAYIWPEFKRRGIPREVAVVCFYLHLIAVGSGRDW